MKKGTKILILVNYVDVWGFEHAIRGMRNPMNSWAKSDSGWKSMYPNIGDRSITIPELWRNNEEMDFYFHIGNNDLELMQKLYKAGPEHRKYARQILISMDITAPLYFWLEMDTYKIGVTCNSCSKMHTLHKSDLTIEDFSCEHLMEASVEMLEKLIDVINAFRRLYNDGDNKHKQFWYNMIQLLPESYNQKRTITMNYENVFNIINQRQEHRLDEWQELCKILLDLPYVREIADLTIEGGNDK